jgi:MFS family permease
MFPVLVADISPIEEIGVRLGINQSASGLAALIGSPVAGVIVAASNGSFMWVAAVTGISCLISAVCICIIRIRLSSKKSWKI